MVKPKYFQIEVAYAAPDQQEIIALQVVAGTTVAEAIELSGMLDKFPEIKAKPLSVGVFGKLANLYDVLQDGDRVEIYRELTIDPKEARRQRAKINLKMRGK